MRQIIVVLLILISTKHYAQNQPPSAQDIRQAIAGEIYAFKIPPEKVFKVENKAVWNGTDSIQIRIYYPKAGKNLAVIFNIHGGALIAGDLDTHDNICKTLCNKTQSIVVAIDYKKPPEAPYPASLNDCETVLNWIKTSAFSFGGNPNKIILVGDSGGGLLITALMIKTKNANNIKCIALINPAVDLREPGGGLYGLVTKWYLNGVPANDSLVSPITATNFSFFPPTLIVTCEKDALKPHGIALLNKLKQANIKTKTIDIPNEDHLGGAWAAAHSDAKLAIDETVTFIKTTIDAIEKINLERVDIKSSINKENPEISDFYLKYKIENKSNRAVTVTLSLPYGEYKNCKAFRENFIMEGTWSQIKTVAANSIEFCSFQEKTKGVYANGKYTKCTGIGDIKYDAIYN